VRLAAAIAWLAASTAFAVTFLPISDATLRARADAIVDGVVLSTRASADPEGRPETITVIAPIDVLKGHVGDMLLLHQLGGSLPDGRASMLGGSPRYMPGTEVLVFAIARPEGDYQTAEMLLGKFDVSRDASGRLFAVPALAGSDAGRVTEFELLQRDADTKASSVKAHLGVPRELAAFKQFLRDPSARDFTNADVVGTLAPVHDATLTDAPIRKWLSLGGLWRWNNGAAASWFLDGTATITGGGATEAANALAAWTNEPNSQIAYTLTSDTSANPIHMAAPTSPCGWNSCLAGAGVVGCGGPSGGGINAWRGDTYNTITSGEVWLRPYCTTNLLSSSETQAVLEHELGHTLGLDHSDTGSSSPHDQCIGDENNAIMVSVSQGQTTLGTDDTDAIRWLYGDAGISCTSRTLNVSVGPSARGSVTSSPAGIACPGTCTATFPLGTVVTLTEIPVSGRVFSGWFGDASGTANPVQVTMNVNRSVDAAFDDPSHPEIFPVGCALPAAGWTNPPPGATTGWRVTNETSSEGDCSLQSNAMSSGPGTNKAQIQFAGTFTAGNVSFDRRVSSEAGYDCLRFLIDGVEQNVQGTCLGVGGTGASGDVAWGGVSVPITSGAHTLTWSYEKDTSVSSGQDAAWIDDVVLPLAGLLLSPNGMLDLGDASIGAVSLAKTINVNNPGAAPIAIGSIAATGDFTLTDDCGTSIPASGTCHVNVVFAPTQAGARQGTLTVHTTSAGDFHVDLAGYGERPMPAAASDVLVPVVAQTSSFAAEVYVRNPNATDIVLEVDFFEADDSSIPGQRPCGAFTVPANATKLLSVASDCTLGAGSHFGMLALHETSGTQAFTAFSRTQTPAGVGFTVDGRPLAAFGPAPAFVDGLKRSSTAPSYQPNCFVAALGVPLDYRIDLTTSDGVPIGSPLAGSLGANHMLRYLDVLALAGAPAGDYSGVRARFSETSPGNAPLVGFCTMQESVTFSADFRIAKANDVAAPSVVVPVVARTASYATEVYVRNPGAAAIGVAVRFDEADNSSQPGSHACNALAVPANATRLLSLASQCNLDAASHFGMLALDDAALPRSHPFTVFSRSQTPAGVGFSVEGYPAGWFGAGAGFVGGLKRTSGGAQYQSNCFIGTLDVGVDYRIDLSSVNGATIGSPLTGSLAPHRLFRFLDVLAAAGAAVGDYAQVTARFSETGGSAPFVGFCTMQESVTFGADFRIAD
jgi:hypothetical protein